MKFRIGDTIRVIETIYPDNLLNQPSLIVDLRGAKIIHKMLNENLWPRNVINSGNENWNMDPHQCSLICSSCHGSECITLRTEISDGV